MVIAQKLGEQVQEITDIFHLNAWLRSRIQAFGFNTHAAGVLTEGGATNFVLLDWPRTWLELYAARGYGAEDCTISAAMSDPTPFTWAEIRERQPGASERVFAAAAEFGWRDGLVIPVHHRDSLRGLIVLAAPTLKLSGGDRQIAVMTALVAFERALRLSSTGGKPAAALSPRQRSVLQMVSGGATDVEIASALGISEPTAAFHLKEARARLGAKTRAHAIAIAVAQGLI